VELLAQAWATFWLIRPELAFRCGPLAGWLNEDPRPKQAVAAAAAAARASVKAGLWSGRLEGQGVLGHLYTEGRSDKGKQARGECCASPAPSPAAYAVPER
jgi:hypothetical protein